MVGEISKRHEAVGARLGRHHTDLQVLIKRPDRHLHDERDRELERHIPQAEPPEKRFPERPGPSEGPLSGYLRSDKEMEYAHPKLGPGIRRAVDHVRRPASRMTR